MAKKKRPRRNPPPKRPSTTAIAEKAIATIAAREGKTVEYIRLQMKAAMMSGLLNDNPVIQDRWTQIPRAGEVQTPEELIAYCATQLSGQ